MYKFFPESERPLKKSLLKLSPNKQVHSCFVIENWRENRTHVEVLICKQYDDKTLILMFCLVDLCATGVRDVFVTLIEKEAHAAFVANAKMFIPCDYTLAQNIIYAGYEYASDLNIPQHPDFNLKKVFLQEIDEVEYAEIPVGGENGKPFYQAQEGDQMAFIMQCIEKKVGKEGFEFAYPWADQKADFIDAYSFVSSNIEKYIESAEFWETELTDDLRVQLKALFQSEVVDPDQNRLMSRLSMLMIASRYADSIEISDDNDFDQALARCCDEYRKNASSPLVEEDEITVFGETLALIYWSQVELLFDVCYTEFAIRIALYELGILTLSPENETAKHK